MIIEVPQHIIDRLNSQLKSVPEKIPDVLKKTINDTAKAGREKIIEQAHKKYTVKRGTFNKAMKIENATIRYFQATIHTEGKPLPLYGFRVRKNNGSKAAKAKVLHSGQLKELILRNGEDNGKDLKAFVVKTKKHIGIFERLNSNERIKQQKFFKKKNKGRKTRKNAIKQLYGPSIPQMTGDEKKVYSVVEPAIKDELRKNLEKHISAVLEGL